MAMYSMDTLYLVYKQGIYMQGVAQVCGSLDMAKIAVDKYLETEPDDYHEFIITEVIINKDVLKVDSFLSEMPDPILYKRKGGEFTKESTPNG